MSISGAQVETASPGFKPHYILDPQHGGLIVAAVDLREHWQAASAVRWSMQNINHPVTLWARANDPHTDDTFERFPDLAFCWLGQQ